MSNVSSRPTVRFWIIGVLALIWNLLGVHGYLQQAYNTEEFQAQYTPEQLEVIWNSPTWLMAAFAIAVFTAAFGCLLFLVKKKVANLLFIISLLAVIPQTIYNTFISDGIPMYDAFQNSMLVAIPLIAIFLVWYSKVAIRKGWLK